MIINRAQAGDNYTYVSPIIKYLLFGFNFLFWCLSLAVLAITIWALAAKHLEPSRDVTWAWSYIFDITIYILVVAVLSLLLSTFGCLGALRENIILLRIFWIALVVVFFLLLIGGIVGFALSPQLLKHVKRDLSDKLIHSYFLDGDQKALIDFTQEEFECCGFSDKGYRDWNKSLYYNCPAKNSVEKNNNIESCLVPESCCRKPGNESKTEGLERRMRCRGEKILDKVEVVLERIYIRGCAEAVGASAKKNLLIISAVFLGLSLVPLLGAFLAVTLAAQVQDQKDRWISNRTVYDPRYIYTSTAEV